MKLRSLSPALLVAGQLLPADLPALASLGVASVVCNRPDNEQADQPDHLAMQSACAQAGMHFAHLPAVARAFSEVDVQQLCQKLELLP
ncbi:sulfur transferase domain-containing protein, partial [Xanthomonas perforans]|uniref:beta-lactamase hydrolase domain-containing protein n=1 Tax=Xanthomonas perforans TaxID=442694 RepID=UPI001F32FFF0